ncbi:hypothetical protein GLS40_05595 [Pseudooceanicola sp. 216_PA32_1]|uniref:Uncharacterized protein n=1 Tax=Pseudooceanicola pacificus TaxID=2676438 RepID=A0A844WBT5_9RHOB|nr:hypothetical protein [Pseudooceanicola pacificus]MWB77492.1 hypothetical protein [Pseudooceanicola pacificus]
MFGVVLWSDSADRKAVIWCEDHGDLAYFNAGDDTDLSMVALDAGDLVQFDLTEEAEMRRATNPRLVAEEQFPTLAHRLQNALPTPDAPATSCSRNASAIIIPLDSARRRSKSDDRKDALVGAAL